MDMKHNVLDGREHFFFGGPLPETVKDFWAWSMSRLMADGPRGDLAEFIVNTALGMDTTIPKRGWGECDIVYRDIRIEIKCSTYLQAWERPNLSKPVFSISKTYPCDIGEYDGGYRYVGRGDNPDLRRRSDIYVFCLFAATDRKTAEPMDLSQWEFYIVRTDIIDRRLGNQRKISMPGLEKLGAIKCSYGEIKEIVDGISADIHSERALS